MNGLNKYSKEDLEKQKEKYLDLLRSTEREGIDDLIEWLNTTDFFEAPASTKGHGSFIGGLLLHSINVYTLLKNFNVKAGAPEDSLIIVGLLHDLCKVGYYKKSLKNVKDPVEKRWVEQEVFIIDDTLPLGHGEKSLFLAERYIRLTDDEAAAIRWHMSGYDDAARSYAGGRAQSAAYEKYPLAVAAAIADMYATYFVD